MKKLWMVAVIVLALSSVTMAVTPTVHFGWSTTSWADPAESFTFSGRQLGVTLSASLTERVDVQVNYEMATGGDLTAKDGATVSMVSNKSTDLTAALFYDALITDTVIAGPLVSYSHHAWKPHQTGGNEESFSANGFGVGGFAGTELGMLWVGASYVYKPRVAWSDGNNDLQGTGNSLSFLVDVPVGEWVSLIGTFGKATMFANDDIRFDASGFTVGAALYF